MSWHRRLFARLGLAETWLATKNLALAVRGADALVTTFPDAATRIWRPALSKWPPALALATGKRKKAEEHLLKALEAVTVSEVPLAAWRVHATAWEAHKETDPRRADSHRMRAEAVIHQLARRSTTWIHSASRFWRQSPFDAFSNAVAFPPDDSTRSQGTRSPTSSEPPLNNSNSPTVSSSWRTLGLALTIASTPSEVVARLSTIVRTPTCCKAATCSRSSGPTGVRRDPSVDYW
jgi:hypothetical protein